MNHSPNLLEQFKKLITAFDTFIKDHQNAPSHIQVMSFFASMQSHYPNAIYLLAHTQGVEISDLDHFAFTNSSISKTLLNLGLMSCNGYKSAYASCIERACLTPNSEDKYAAPLIPIIAQLCQELLQERDAQAQKLPELTTANWRSTLLAFVPTLARQEAKAI